MLLRCLCRRPKTFLLADNNLKYKCFDLYEVLAKGYMLQYEGWDSYFFCFMAVFVLKVGVVKGMKNKHFYLFADNNCSMSLLNLGLLSLLFLVINGKKSGTK